MGRCGRRTVENERNKLVEMGRKIRLAGPAHRPDKEAKTSERMLYGAVNETSSRELVMLGLQGSASLIETV